MTHPLVGRPSIEEHLEDIRNWIPGKKTSPVKHTLDVIQKYKIGLVADYNGMDCIGTYRLDKYLLREL